MYVYCNFMVCSASRKGQGSADQTKENSLRLNMYIYIYMVTLPHIYIYMYDIYIYIHIHVAMQQVEKYIKITVQLPGFLQQFATHFEQSVHLEAESAEELVGCSRYAALGPLVWWGHRWLGLVVLEGPGDDLDWSTEYQMDVFKASGLTSTLIIFDIQYFDPVISRPFLSHHLPG